VNRPFDANDDRVSADRPPPYRAAPLFRQWLHPPAAIIDFIVVSTLQGLTFLLKRDFSFVPVSQVCT